MAVRRGWVRKAMTQVSARVGAFRRATWRLRTDGTAAPVYDDGTEAEMHPPPRVLMRIHGNPMDWLQR
jgi:hypothetical protein